MSTASSSMSIASSSIMVSSMTLPNELWLPIFEYLPPQSLGCVVLTSKKFYAIAIRLLYKHLILASPTSFVTSYSVLSLMQPAPHALLLGISPARGRNVEQLKEAVAVVSFADANDWTSIPVGADRQSTRTYFSQIKDAYQPRFLADPTVYSTLLTKVVSFTSLRQLVFRGMLLPQDFRSIVHGLPHLRNLAIVHCTLPVIRTPLEPTNTSLEIESLTVLDIRYAIALGPDDNDIARTALRRFATAPTLRTLTYDHTVWIHRIFTLSAPCPPLTALDVKFPIQRDRDRARVPHGFIPFLEALPTLRTLILRNHVPSLPLPPHALPALRTISAPFSTIPSICSGRKIIQLDIRDEAVLAPLYKGFVQVRSHLFMVKELSLFLGDWDDEVVLAIVAHFPALTKLQIRYARGGPSEDTIIGMGSRTLHTLKKLDSVNIFQITLPPRIENHLFEVNGRDDDTSYGAPGIDDTYFQSMHDIDPVTDTEEEDMVTDDEDDAHSTPSQHYAHSRCSHGIPYGMQCHKCITAARRGHSGRATAAGSAPRSNFQSKCNSEPELEEFRVSEPFDDYTRELVIAWNRACPALRNVQLHPGWVWRRANPADSWVARPCQRGVWGNVFGSTIDAEDLGGNDQVENGGQNRMPQGQTITIRLRGSQA
ncbi:uncharacterized protein EDB91DRAFT_1172519 [Suillus paluster]|uniref:uncharacterized protein n=1 Tax=Suillus paluster TaxID=48578 RepID=UPI001B86B85A|nr:uncharacterized protein EDB91DRAFT_1172519 [Suillus paluster]KAG1723531.1 hypothetical protein EDB91DRAFT_1172519 [Suillus paluster]